jgi:hypothetical protein
MGHKQTAPWECAAKEPSRLRKHTLERGPYSRTVPQHGYQKVNRGAAHDDIGGPAPHDITYRRTGPFLAAINGHSAGGSRARRTRLHAGPPAPSGDRVRPTPNRLRTVAMKNFFIAASVCIIAVYAVDFFLFSGRYSDALIAIVSQAYQVF